MQSLLVGLLSGFALAYARAPRGLDLLQWPAADQRVLLSWRCAGLVLLGCIILASRNALRHETRLATGRWLLGALIGFASVSLVVDPWFTAQSNSQLIVGLGLILGAALLLGWFANRRDREREQIVSAPKLLAVFGLGLCGLGVAIALESLASWLRFFGENRPADHALSGSFLLFAGLAGTLSFRGLFQTWKLNEPRLSSTTLAAGISLAATACLVSILALSSVALRDELERFVLGFRSTLGHHAQWDYGLIVSARGFVLPGLLLGAALSALRYRLEFAILSFGAALGLLLHPGLSGLVAERALESAHSPSLSAAVGVSATLIGLLFTAIATELRSPRLFAVIGLPATLGLGCLIGLPKPQALPLYPWTLVRPDQDFEQQTQHGYLSLEWARGQSRVLTLDRFRLTPLSEELQVDRYQLQLSLGLLDREQTPSPKVLLIGQMTPDRARTFAAAGIAEVDRSAVWYASMAEIEAQLFAGLGQAEGAILSVTEAKTRLANQHYDLVIAPSVNAPAPALATLKLDTAPANSELEAEEQRQSVVVRWARTDRGLERMAWNGPVLSCSEGFVDWSLGFVQGIEQAEFDARKAASQQRFAEPSNTGELVDNSDSEEVFRGQDTHSALRAWNKTGRGEPTWKHLTPILFQRRANSQRACAERLQASAESEDDKLFADAFAEHFGKQVYSADWENRVSELEFVEGAYAKLSQLGARSVPDASLALFWEGAAEQFAHLREIQALFDYVAPLAQAYPFWAALERPLARADLEFLDPESAGRRLSRLSDLDPLNMELLTGAAVALSMAGEHQAAAGRLRQAREIQPDRRDLRRALAEELVRAGDSAGVAMVKQLMEEDPEDDHLAAFLGAGPFPAVDVSFSVTSDAHDHGDHGGSHSEESAAGEGQAEPSGHEGHDHNGHNGHDDHDH